MSPRTVLRACPDIAAITDWYQNTFSITAEPLADTSDLAKITKTTITAAAVVPVGAESIVYIEVPEADFSTADLSINHVMSLGVSLVTRDMDAHVAAIEKSGVAIISKKPDTLPVWTEGIAGMSYYLFRDPVGHPLMLTEYANKSGVKRWLEFSEQLLGIDTIFVTVKDYAKSMDFYEELKLAHQSGSHNFGKEWSNICGIDHVEFGQTQYRAAKSVAGAVDLTIWNFTETAKEPKKVPTTQWIVWSKDAEVPAKDPTGHKHIVF